MKRYLLFAGDNYYPAGGWDDFKGSFGTKGEAISEGDAHDYDWFEVVDTEIEQVISLEAEA